MLSIQQVIKALRRLHNTTHNAELLNIFKQQIAATAAVIEKSNKPTKSAALTAAPTLSVAAAAGSEAESIVCESNSTTLASVTIATSSHALTATNKKSLKQQQEQLQKQEGEVTEEETKAATVAANNSSQQQQQQQQHARQTTSSHHQHYCRSQQQQQLSSLISHLSEYGSALRAASNNNNILASAKKSQHTTKTIETIAKAATTTTVGAAEIRTNSYLQRSQQIQQFYQQQLHYFHTQHNRSLYAKQKQTKFAMSSLAAEPIAVKQLQDDVSAAVDSHNITKDANASCNTNSNNDSNENATTNSTSSSSSPAAAAAASSNKKPCFNTGFGEIIKFMELIGNLKHTKRTGWVLRDVNDCESISGHMYRMSMMTFLLDGSEGLNQIRCMELALVHDLAESLVGDITPFCGISKVEKRAMEFKAMDDICKLIEPRGKRIMELFEEYEEGNSEESKFVKDLDRLDMVMQAFEYEKRDNCLLKHQEFFDSTEGKFKHPFIKKLVNEIYEQRKDLARAKGATPPPYVYVPNMEDNNLADASTNGHCTAGATATLDAEQQQQRQQLSPLLNEKSTSSNSS